MPTDEHLRLFASCDVCLGPSRWEGLGLFLYEAIAFGMPQITNDSPPMNEVVSDGVNGLLVADVQDDVAPSGIPSMKPDVAGLTAAIERLAEPGERERLAEGARSSREEFVLGAHRRRLRGADRAGLASREGRGARSSARSPAGSSRRSAIRRARRAAPAAGAVRRRRDPLGDDAAAADARRASRASRSPPRPTSSPS